MKEDDPKKRMSFVGVHIASLDWSLRRALKYMVDRKMNHIHFSVSDDGLMDVHISLVPRTAQAEVTEAIAKAWGANYR